MNQVIMVGRITEINKENKTITILESKQEFTCKIDKEHFDKIEKFMEIDKTIGLKGKLINKVTTGEQNIEILVDKLTFLA